MDLPDSRSAATKHELDLHQPPSKTQNKKEEKRIGTATSSKRRWTNKKKTSHRLAIYTKTETTYVYKRKQETQLKQQNRGRIKGQLPQKCRKPCPMALPLQLLCGSSHLIITLSLPTVHAEMHVHGTLTTPIAPHQLHTFSNRLLCTHKRRWHVTHCPHFLLGRISNAYGLWPFEEKLHCCRSPFIWLQRRHKATVLSESHPMSMP